MRAGRPGRLGAISSPLKTASKRAVLPPARGTASRRRRDRGTRPGPGRRAAPAGPRPKPGPPRARTRRASAVHLVPHARHSFLEAGIFAEAGEAVTPPRFIGRLGLVGPP